MFSNWTRKTGGFVLIVWALMVLTITWFGCHRYPVPTLAEWGGYVTAAVLAACGVLAILSGKSIGSTLATKGNGESK